MHKNKNKINNKNKNIDKTKITRIDMNVFNECFQYCVVVWIIL